MPNEYQDYGFSSQEEMEYWQYRDEQQWWERYEQLRLEEEQEAEEHAFWEWYWECFAYNPQPATDPSYTHWGERAEAVRFNEHVAYLPIVVWEDELER